VEPVWHHMLIFVIYCFKETVKFNTHTNLLWQKDYLHVFLTILYNPNINFRIFQYNKWESVWAVIDGCGRLDVKHLILLWHKIQFYKRLFYTNDCVLFKLFRALLSTDSMYNKCMISVFTCDAASHVYMQFRADLTDWGADGLIQWFYFSVLLFSVFTRATLC